MKLLQQKKFRDRGFTLVELMIVLLVAAVLLGLGIPSFQTMIKNNQLVNVTNEIVGAINFARIEAINRGDSVHLSQGSGDIGWVVWVDSDTDGNWDDGEEIRVWSAVPTNVSVAVAGDFVVSGKPELVFKSTGVINATGSFTICDDRSGETGKKIEILGVGALNSNTLSCS